MRPPWLLSTDGGRWVARWRIGVITELIRMDFPIPAVQKVREHESVQVLLG